MKLAPFYLISLTLIGLADAAYLSYFAYIGSVPSCAIGGCSDVLTSQYSKFIMLPLAYWGVAYYLGMLSMSIYLAARPFKKTVRWSVLLWAWFGLLCSVVFVYIQGVLIGHYCMYCLISAATTVLLSVTALWHFYSTRSTT